MNFEDLHNELESFPSELNYTEERWAETLQFVKAHERAMFWKKAAFFTFITGIVVLALYFLPNTDENLVAEYEPRQITIESSPAPLTDSNTVSQNIKEEQSFTEKTQAKAIKQDQDVITTQNKSEEVQPDNKQLVASNDNFRNTQETNKLSEGEKKSFVNPLKESIEDSKTASQKLSSNEIQNTSSSIEVDSNKLYKESIRPDNSITSPEVSLNQFQDDAYENKLGLFGTKKSLLRSGAIKKELVRKSFKTGKERFTVYKEFLALKVGINPWADYGTLSNNITPTVGLFYEKTLVPNVTWNAGIEYFNLSGFDLAVSSTSTTYNFSAENTIHTVHTDKAHFVSVPINLGVRVIPRVQVKAGLNTTVLLQTENTLEQHSEIADNNTLLDSEKTQGYRTSLRTFNLAASASVNFWLSPRNSLQFSYFRGFTDFSKNDSFNDNTEHLTSRFEIGLNRVIR